jgi:hypothetical protein
MKYKKVIVFIFSLILVFCFITPSYAKESVSSLEKEINLLKSQIDGLTKSNTSLKEQVSSLKKEVLIPKSVIGQWVGTYTAPQGETKVTLTFESYNLVKFEFGPTNNNPNIPSGSFLMDNKYNSKDGFIEMDALKWLNQPSNWQMVDFEGSYSGKYINGTVLNGNTKVGTFSVEKIK